MKKIFIIIVLLVSVLETYSQILYMESNKSYIDIDKVIEVSRVDSGLYNIPKGFIPNKKRGDCFYSITFEAGVVRTYYFTTKLTAERDRGVLVHNLRLRKQRLFNQSKGYNG